MDTELIKQRLSLRDVAARLGFEPDRVGKIRCPLHGDQDPSLQLYPNGRGWYCFGCQRGGDVIGFIQQVNQISFREALRVAADMAGVEIDRPISGWERQKHAARLNDVKREQDQSEAIDTERFRLQIRKDRLEQILKEPNRWGMDMIAECCMMLSHAELRLEELGP